MFELLVIALVALLILGVLSCSEPRSNEHPVDESFDKTMLFIMENRGHSD